MGTFVWLFLLLCVAAETRDKSREVGVSERVWSRREQTQLDAAERSSLIAFKTGLEKEEKNLADNEAAPSEKNDELHLSRSLQDFASSESKRRLRRAAQPAGVRRLRRATLGKCAIVCAAFRALLKAEGASDK